ncbi:uncharacterized protein GVI51_B01507 [Nakaseomyces glabratus]|uniref:Reduced growth phenotype protein 1 n=1 Tax=Candida glabrata (strain ATCC 2001 / BCRC 20586 / JCM 3761 / NBRC 0622 / NRRL Y-65 / CBS 138) TaxID=284593 RepID=Q6FX98_CANGA|nr:uncharacterized protein CAGL0B01639g [Nakaseomyces glabratus]KAH7609071.1 Rgp1 [Nakaseomyces glabratus]KAH7609946.1 Rgp1 [Nakaseomyces glabratus]KAI8390442.1 Rgp1 [Nakaseomyces glabratus]KAJ9570862.1 Golgi membrane exchange factor (Ric1p-Rgp1p) subunit [Nakaseomyces glabratus]OXB45119.1 hypothetical protein B1J91_B01639g [Nakaseomyces glabratus]|eukprot:XP_445041.1 uncharacterized protein CAGL0B01639g [[Candida] glabrata]
MHLHKIDAFYITDNVKVELIHESNPFFAGEPISIIVRIKHLGSLRERDHLETTLNNLNGKIQRIRQENREILENEIPESKWSLRNMFSKKNGDESAQNATDSNLTLITDVKEQLVLLEKSRERLTKDLKFNSIVNFVSCYLQVSGKLQYDNSIIDKSTFKSNDSKLLGVTYADSTAKQLNEESISKSDKYVNSEYANITEGLRFGYREDEKIINDTNISMGANDRENSNAEYEQVPIFLIPQTLIFSEINLEPGEAKTFLFKSQPLNKEICPTYMLSNFLSVLYDAEFGITGVVDGNLIPIAKKVPISIAPYVLEGGMQASSVLNRPAVIQGSGTVKEIKSSPSSIRRASAPQNHVSNTLERRYSVERRSSLYERRLSINFERKNSNPTVVDDIEPERLSLMKENFIKIISDKETNYDDIDKLVDNLVEVQFDKDEKDKDSKPDIELEEEHKNEEYVVTRKRSDSVRDHIAELQNTPNMQYNVESYVIDGVTMIPQLANLQSTYQINRNGETIAKVVFSKPFFMTSDDIDISVTLDDCDERQTRITGISAILQSFVLLNPRFAVDKTSKAARPKGKTVAVDNSISFDDFTSISFKLSPSKTPTNHIAGQFKSDIFQHKWMVLLKFVIQKPIEDGHLEQFYEDKKGRLFHAKETMEGEEFSCHIPIPIITASQEFGGW